MLQTGERQIEYAGEAGIKSDSQSPPNGMSATGLIENRGTADSGWIERFASAHDQCSIGHGVCPESRIADAQRPADDVASVGLIENVELLGGRIN